MNPQAEIRSVTGVPAPATDGPTTTLDKIVARNGNAVEIPLLEGSTADITTVNSTDINADNIIANNIINTPKLIAPVVHATSSFKIGDDEVDFLLAMNPVGKYSWFNFYQEPSPAFPWLHLAQSDLVLSESNWPLLVPHLRNIKLTYFDNGSGTPVNSFTIVSYSRTSNIASIVLATNSINDNILAALVEEQVIQGDFSSRLLYIPVSLGSIDSGEYTLTGINTGTRTITFASSGIDIGSTPSSSSVEFYMHRILGSSTTAKHFRTTGRSLMTVGDANGYIVGGLRRRDTFQGHQHNQFEKATVWDNFGYGSHVQSAMGYAGGGSVASVYGQNEPTYGPQITDGSNGTPRTAKNTQPNSLGAFLYIWGGKYVL